VRAALRHPGKDLLAKLAALNECKEFPMKKTDRSLKSMLSFGAAALLAMGAATAQVATDKSFPGATGIDNSGSYKSEVQACMSGHTQQSREDCLKEARNSAAEKQRGRLETYAALESNAMARCDVHKIADDRAACRARVAGTGDIEGSVAGGGLLREIETPDTTRTLGNR
jgi:hypothetical protein